MCGIAGYIDLKKTSSAEKLRTTAKAMSDVIAARGPDEGNVWVEEKSGIALGHRRLSIVDLSSAGRQPMHSSCERFVLSYNGEIYNSSEMRDELVQRGHNFKGHSDTEVLVEACAQWGLEEALKRCIGMFALALWDRKTHTLSLARDRVGIKPLYWLKRQNLFAFASQIGALKVHNGWQRELDRDAMSLFIRHNYYPAPHTVYKDVRHLEPGHILILKPGKEPEIHAYWSLENVVETARANPFMGDEIEATKELEALTRDAVRRRMVSDVPLGAFLSGGYDSSAVVALMQSESSEPVRTFSIGFHEDAYNEARHAKAVAAHLKTDHTELYVTADECRDVIPQLPAIYDEPFADSSQIPTYLVSKLAREHVTVALSGDGGDELFAGYNRYAQAARFRRFVTKLPRGSRKGGARLIESLTPSSWDRLFQFVPASRRPMLAGDKMHKLAGVLAEDGDGFFHKLTSHWLDPENIVPGSCEPRTIITDERVPDIVPDFIERMQYRDILSYLPGDILTKVDRASMAVSLEARVPLLDHRLIEFSWRLPMDFKLRGTQKKWLLRQMVYKHVPKKLLDRPKMGFGVPIDSWLRGPLKEWAEDLLSEQALKSRGIFNTEPIRQRWEEHLSGRRNWQHSLWNILMFEAWSRSGN